MSSPPSARKVTCWLSCMPWPRRTSYGRRLGLRSRVCTNARHLAGPPLAGTDLPATTSNRPSRSHPITPEPAPGASALWSRRVRSWKAVTPTPPAGPAGRGSGHWLRSAPPGPAPRQAVRRPAILAVPRVAAAATAIALVSSACRRAARAGTSAAANAAVSPAGRAAPASGSETNAGASRRQGAVSHRGPGPAGTRGPARSARSPGCPDPARSCGAGSSRANQRSAPALRTPSPVSG